MNMKMTKTQMYDLFCTKNLKLHFDEKMTKKQLIELYENLTKNVKNEKFEIVSKNETIQTIQNNDENKNNFENSKNDDDDVISQYLTFLLQNNLQYKIDYEKFTIIVIANKKHIFTKIDIEKNHFYVFTILNKKLSNDMNENKKNSRNILTLKSLRALKSYTLSNCK